MGESVSALWLFISMELKFTRHALNEMRRLKISRSEVESMVSRVAPYDLDLDGRPRYMDEIRGIRVRVVLALDKPNLVVSLHRRRKR